MSHPQYERVVRGASDLITVVEAHFLAEGIRDVRAFSQKLASFSRQIYRNLYVCSCADI